MSRASFAMIALLIASTHSGATDATETKSCTGKLIGSPVKGSLQVISPFQTGVHYGVDYKTNGESVTSVADGTISAIKWDLRELPTSNTRTGLKIQGWGRYVIVHHADGGESLYAHLDKSSTDSLKVGLPITKGQVIGKADSTGAVTGAHLHFEYSPSGSIFIRANKRDGDVCVGRTGTLTVYSLTKLQGGSFKVYLDGTLLGQTSIGEKLPLTIPPLPPRQVHRIRLELVKTQRGKEASYALDFSEPFEFLNDRDEITGQGSYGELKEGDTIEIKFLAQ